MLSSCRCPPCTCLLCVVPWRRKAVVASCHVSGVAAKLFRAVCLCPEAHCNRNPLSPPMSWWCLLGQAAERQAASYCFGWLLCAGANSCYMAVVTRRLTCVWGHIAWSSAGLPVRLAMRAECGATTERSGGLVVSCGGPHSVVIASLRCACCLHSRGSRHNVGSLQAREEVQGCGVLVKRWSAGWVAVHMCFGACTATRVRHTHGASFSEP